MIFVTDDKVFRGRVKKKCYSAGKKRSNIGKSELFRQISKKNGLHKTRYGPSEMLLFQLNIQHSYRNILHALPESERRRYLGKSIVIMSFEHFEQVYKQAPLWQEIVHLLHIGFT